MSTKIPPYSQALYDANIIIYYCFFVNIKGGITLKYSDFTSKSHKLTKEFIDNNIDISSPQLIINEIHRKGIAVIVDEYCDSYEGKSRLGFSYVPDALRHQISERITQKLRKLKDKDWFKVINYIPDMIDIDAVEKFYTSIETTTKMVEHMDKKGVDSPVPSYHDMLLICCSSDCNAPIITNDSDITNFSSELKSNGHCFEVINLNDVS